MFASYPGMNPNFHIEKIVNKNVIEKINPIYSDVISGITNVNRS